MIGRVADRRQSGTAHVASYPQGLFELAIERLEAVASRLEASEARLSGAAPQAPLRAPQSTANAGPAVPTAPINRAVSGCSITAPAATATSSDSVAAYDQLVMPPLSALAEAGAMLGPDVGAVTQIIDTAFKVSSLRWHPKRPDASLVVVYLSDGDGQPNEHRI